MRASADVQTVTITVTAVGGASPAQPLTFSKVQCSALPSGTCLDKKLNLAWLLPSLQTSTVDPFYYGQSAAFNMTVTVLPLPGVLTATPTDLFLQTTGRSV